MNDEHSDRDGDPQSSVPAGIPSPQSSPAVVTLGEATIDFIATRVGTFDTFPPFVPAPGGGPPRCAGRIYWPGGG